MVNSVAWIHALKHPMVRHSIYFFQALDQRAYGARYGVCCSNRTGSAKGDGKHLEKIRLYTHPLSLLLIKYFPDYGVQYARWSGGLMWIGVTLQKNGLGRLCLIAAFFLIWSITKTWMQRDVSVSKFQSYADFLVLFISLWLLKGPENAYSATAIASFIIGLVMYFGLLRMKKHKIFLGANVLMAMMALVIGFGVITSLAGGVTLEGATSTLGRDETLTGRTEIWAILLPDVEKHPFLGYGFGGYWTSETHKEEKIREAHSGYLDALLDLGFVGLFLLAIYLLSFCRKAQRKMAYDYDWAILCICLLLMALLHNVTESSINSFTSPLTAVLLFLSITSSSTSSHTRGGSLDVTSRTRKGPILTGALP